MIRDGHPDFALCLIELRSRYEARNTKMVESALAGLTPIMMDRYREILLYEMMCNIRHQFGE